MKKPSIALTLCIAIAAAATIAAVADNPHAHLGQNGSAFLGRAVHLLQAPSTGKFVESTGCGSEHSADAERREAWSDRSRHDHH